MAEAIFTILGVLLGSGVTFLVSHREGQRERKRMEQQAMKHCLRLLSQVPDVADRAGLAKEREDAARAELVKYSGTIGQATSGTAARQLMDGLRESHHRSSEQAVQADREVLALLAELEILTADLPRPLAEIIEAAIDIVRERSAFAPEQRLQVVSMTAWEASEHVRSQLGIPSSAGGPFPVVRAMSQTMVANVEGARENRALRYEDHTNNVEQASSE